MKKHQHVCCTNGSCEARPYAIIPYKTVAPGVLQVPAHLVCASCSFVMFVYPCNCQEEK